MGLFDKKKSDTGEKQAPMSDSDKKKNAHYELHKAVVKGNFARVTALLHSGYNVNEVDDHGLTALDLAHVHDYSKIIHFLQDHGGLKSKELKN